MGIVQEEEFHRRFKGGQRDLLNERAHIIHGVKGEFSLGAVDVDVGVVSRGDFWSVFFSHEQLGEVEGKEAFTNAVRAVKEQGIGYACMSDKAV